MTFAFYDLCPFPGITQEVKNDVQSSNCLTGMWVTIFWKQILYSKYAPFFYIQSALQSPVVEVLSDVAHSCLCSILCGAWFIGAQQMFLSMNEGKTKLILARYLKNLLCI